MKFSVTKARKVVALAAGGLMFFSYGAFAAGPIGASIQANVNEHDADDTNAEPVVVSVVLTQNNSMPTPRLGEDGATLPAGWYFYSSFNQPDLGVAGCKLVPANFDNYGAGIYKFEIAPNTCNWVAGEYHYQLIVHKVGKGGGGLYRGTTLGSFVIPDNPANNTP